MGNIRRRIFELENIVCRSVESAKIRDYLNLAEETIGRRNKMEVTTKIFQELGKTNLIIGSMDRFRDTVIQKYIEFTKDIRDDWERDWIVELKERLLEALENSARKYPRFIPAILHDMRKYGLGELNYYVKYHRRHHKSPRRHTPRC